MKRIAFILTVILFVLPDLHSQSVLDQFKKYNLKKIEYKAIKKTRKQLKIPKDKNLSAISYFLVGTIKDYNQNMGTTSELLLNLELKYNHVTCFVYDDSLNVLAEANTVSKQVAPIFNQKISKRDLYVKFFKEIAPEYIMMLVFKSDKLPSILYLYYKEKNLYLAYMSEDETKINSYPLNEVKDWRLFNPEMGLNKKGQKI